MRWTFEYQDEKGNWHKSRVAHKQVASACDAAAAWMEVCETNGYRVAVRICEAE